MVYDCIIVGAGASGLMAAITAARQGSSVLVLEQKDKAGKKILATGNGKCNFTNKFQARECYRSDDSAFAMKVLSCFDTTRTLRFFEELGVYPKERDGYYYPNSEQAASIVSVLMLECAKLKISFCYNETVKLIKKPYYTVITEVAGQSVSKTYQAKRLILSTGGCASPKLGSDGSGYPLVKSLGHRIVKPLPALVQLKSPDKYCKTVAGVRTYAAVTAFAGKVKLASEEGEIIFTDYGISGIPVMQISRYVAKALDQCDKVILKLDLLSEVPKQEIIRMLQQRIRQNSSKTMEELLLGILNHKLSYVIIKEAGLDPLKLSMSMKVQEIEIIAAGMKEFRMNINDTNSFENAQVCAGGAATEEINPETMESKLVPGLYLTGELVDVDGTCGGYNLQWAWSSGYLAGLHAGKRID